MSALDSLIFRPRRRELDHVELAAHAEAVWELVRHAPIGHSKLTQALFAIRTLPERVSGKRADGAVLHVDEMRSSEDRPGFQILIDDPPREVVVGAIGKVWKPTIPFTHVRDAAAFEAFTEPGWIKVAWALRVVPRGPHAARLEVELRVDATDDASWKKFQRYFLLIGSPSRWIRRSLLASLRKRLGTPETHEDTRPLPGDELLPDARAQVTDAITIAAPPAQIWPWLAQMGCRRGGFYSIDMLDNGGVPSAREIHDDLQHLAVGDIIPATPHGADGFEVLRVDPPRTLVLGGLYDAETKRQVPFSSTRPRHYWNVTWSFSLEPLDDHTTRVHARARAAFPRGGRLHAMWIRPAHAVMQAVQLRNLAARAEGRLRRDGWRDIVDGLRGAARIALDFAPPHRPGVGSSAATRSLR